MRTFLIGFVVGIVGLLGCLFGALAAALQTVADMSFEFCRQMDPGFGRSTLDETIGTEIDSADGLHVTVEVCCPWFAGRDDLREVVDREAHSLLRQVRVAKTARAAKTSF